ncbi:MAG: hypothetical protein ACREMS_04785 [Gemmatimonadaceae bacterium]
MDQGNGTRYLVPGTAFRLPPPALTPTLTSCYPSVMVRRFIIRSFAAAFAVCFAFVTVHPAFADPCPVHEPALAMLAMAGHHTHHSPSGHDSKSHHCNCVGSGDCVSAFALVTPLLTFAPAVVSAATDAHVSPPQVAANARAEHSLPFSTAPPQPLIG